VLLPDDIPDSVEGLPGGTIIYKMKAIVERAGFAKSNITFRKVLPDTCVHLLTCQHIRIVRTMSPTSFEFLQSQVTFPPHVIADADRLFRASKIYGPINVNIQLKSQRLRILLDHRFRIIFI
jgi:hypothetical protein